MSSRLDDLRRQRALMQENLAWLDREIAREAGGAEKSPPAHEPGITAVRPPPTPAAAGGDVDQLFAQFRAEEEKNSAPPSKTGCWVAFSVILLVLVVTVIGLVFFLYH